MEVNFILIETLIDLYGMGKLQNCIVIYANCMGNDLKIVFLVTFVLMLPFISIFSLEFMKIPQTERRLLII